MGSSSNVNCTSSPLGDKYPYPTEFHVLDFVPKLSSEENYKNWKKLMKDFINRRGLIGFIDGTSTAEESNQDDYMAWKRLDNLVQGWMLTTLSEEIRLQVLSEETRLRVPSFKFKTAKELWKGLKRILDVTRSVLPEQERLMSLTIINSKIEDMEV
ncbi:uncharacterized protein LOC131298569 [Rhododendron vialii]|uniref:uncharacterized protein LOC131298569 n=1 Tax=Rhododendron vialii TaxID=182163 RepID=UPI00265DF7A6|nr:uncharacterized protein LOC131298569 [Rhododendron vialii]